jgi:hypothetical protein
MSNEEWVNPNDPEAEIMRMKDGRTALAYKAEQAVDMQAGAMVTVTTHGGAAADTETIEPTGCEAGMAVDSCNGREKQEGRHSVHPQGRGSGSLTRDVPSNEVVRDLCAMGVRATSRNQSAGRATGKADLPKKKRCMRTGGGFGVSGASACWPGAGNASSATSRINSTPAV